MRRAVLVTVLITAVLFAAPKERAQRYWQALSEGNLSKAAAQTLRGEVPPLPYDIRILSADLATPERNATLARIPTTIRYKIEAEGLGAMECNATASTELIETKAGWRVDAVSTAKALEQGVQKSAAACAARMFDVLIAEGLAAFEQMRKTMEKEGKSLGEVLQKTMEDLERQMAQQMRRMQKQLERDLNRTRRDVSLPPPEAGERI